MKKLISMVTCFSIIAALVTGCGSTNSNTESSSSVTASTASGTVTATPEHIELSVGLWPNADDTENITEFEGWKKTFEGKYPNITIKPDPYRYAPDTFLIKAASGQLPNIWSTFYTETQKIINAGYAADVSDAAKSYGFVDNYNPDVFKICEKDGKYYGIPTEVYNMGLMLNMKLFRQAGLVNADGSPQYPKTWAEVAETSKIIKEKTGKAGFIMPTNGNIGGWHFTSIAWGFGVNFETQVDGKWKSTFNSPEGVAALQYVKDLKWKDNVLLPNTLIGWSEWIKFFSTDQGAMVLCGDVNQVVRDYKFNKDDIAFVPTPAGPAGPASLMGGGVVMFSNNATPGQIDAGFKFMDVMGTTARVTPETLSTAESSLKWFSDNKNIIIPAGLTLYNNPEDLAKLNELYKKYTNVEMKLFNAFVIDGAKGIRPENPISQQDLYAALDKAIQQVLADKNADPKAVLDKTAADFQKNFLDKAK